MGNGFQAFITKYIIKIGFVLISCTLILYALIHISIKKPNKRDDLIYDSDYCVNGEYCDFCTPSKCICFLGWTGKKCDTLLTDDYFYDTNWWNMASENVYVPLDYYDIHNKTQCADSCQNNTDECIGYIWNPCVSYTIPVLDSCVTECKHIRNKCMFDRPQIITNYERLPIQVEPPRRILEEMPASQEWMYLKNGVKCMGYVCHYSEDYGFVYIDEISYRVNHGIMSTNVYLLFDLELSLEELEAIDYTP